MITRDAGVYLPISSLPTLPHDVGIRQERSGHRDEVGAATPKYRFDRGRRVDPIRGAKRNRHDLLVAELLRHEREGAPGDARGNGRYRRRVPGCRGGMDKRGKRASHGISEKETATKKTAARPRDGRRRAK